MKRRDPMRTFAWVCVLAGILIAVGAIGYVSYRDAAIRREISALGPAAVIPYSIEARREAILRDEQQGLTHWPGVITGAIVTAFGILVLAIRKPEKES